MKTFMMSFALAAMVIAAPVFAADSKGALDGKSFAVVVKSADGKTTDDTISFKDGKLECSLSKAQGYAPAAYTAKTEGSMTHVAAELKDEKGDSRKITAMVTGDKLTGSIDAKEGSKTSKMTIAPKPAKTAAAAPAPVAPVAPTAPKQ